MRSGNYDVTNPEYVSANRYGQMAPQQLEATTVAGLIMHEAQTIPEAGQTFTFYGYRFEVARKQRNRITAVRVRKLAGAAGAAAQR